MSEMIFDFVIVGSGTAGCVLANRLSENPDIKVCLVEAGPKDNTPLVHIPSFVGTLMFHKKYGWGYKTTPQTSAGNREIPLPRGHVLGGCSSTNGMAYFRGHPLDYDEWRDMGNPGWSFSEILPYFLRSECNLDYKDSPFHGVDGEMEIGHVRQYNPMIKPFLEASTELGFNRCPDFNGCMDPNGFDIRQNAISDGRRVSGVTAFLKPAMKRQNLTVITDCFVNKVIIENNSATGIEVHLHGNKQIIQARREVLLSSGAYGSPAILQHSGVGDQKALSQLGIEVKHHLPQVGKDLHDHPSSVVQMSSPNSESYGISWKALPRNIVSVFQYLLSRKGQLAGNLFEVTGFIRSEKDIDRPDLQIVFMPATRPTPKFPFPLGHGFGVNSVLLRPKSRGSVTISSNDPRQSPLIDSNFLGNEEDIIPLVRGLKIARSLLASSQLSTYQGNEILPGAALETDDELISYIRSTCTPVHHPGGSCRMGNDDASVVDSKLKVRGINGLRVIDASIFPRVVSGNTNAPVVMIAEKASDLILNKPAPPPIHLS